MLNCKIFVYGTLMEGFVNYNIYLKGRTVSAVRAFIYGSLYHLESRKCPAIIDGSDKVYGQVICFNDDESETVQKQIDEMEKYFFGCKDIIYVREPAEVHYIDGTTEMLSFYKFVDSKRLETEGAVYIPSGDWKEYVAKISYTK